MVKEYFTKCIFYILFISYIVIVGRTTFFYFSHPVYLFQTDLMNFLTGAMIIREGEVGDLYNNETQLYYQNKITYPYQKHRLLPFRNIPLAGAFYIPFTFVNLKTATAMIFVVNVGLLLLFRKLFTSNVSKHMADKGLLLLTFIFWPSVATLVSGQIMVLILVVFGLIFILLKQNKYVATGVFSALLFLRPQNLLILPFLYLIVGNKKRFLLGFFVTALILLIINISISGIDVLLDYPKFVMSIENLFFEERMSEVSSVYFTFKDLFPFINRPTILFMNVFLYMLCVTVFIIKKKGFSLTTSYFASIIITLLFSIHVLSHDLLILLIPIYLLYIKNNKRPIYHKNGIPLLLFITPFFNILGVSVVSTFLLIFILLYIFYPNSFNKLIPRNYY